VNSVPERETRMGGDRFLAAVLHSCLSRVLRWRVPPNWSISEWRIEIRAEAACAVWQAVSEYDPSRGVPFSAFARQRVLTQTLTRFRQEWAYALRCVQEPNSEPNFAAYVPFEDWPREALARLSEADLWLVGQLFLRDRTEADVAKQIGITQQGVNKRKRLILVNLRQFIGREPAAMRHTKKRTQVVTEGGSRITSKR
jgi:Sigma-70 region 2